MGIGAVCRPNDKKMYHETVIKIFRRDPLRLKFLLRTWLLWAVPPSRGIQAASNPKPGFEFRVWEVGVYGLGHRTLAERTTRLHPGTYLV